MRARGRRSAAGRGCTKVESGSARGVIAVLLLMTILASLPALLAACGEETPAPPGTYVYKSGDSSFATDTLMLASDKTWTMVEGDDETAGIGGTWKLTWTGLAIKFTADFTNETIKADYDGSEIEFDDVVWTRAQ